MARVSRAFRVTMAWQAAATAVLAAVAGLAAGSAGFLSAVLGGAIGTIGVLVFALIAGRRTQGTAEAVRTALRAEAAKVIVIVLLLWLSYVGYRDMVVPAFLGAFAISVLLSGLAFAVSGD